VTLGVILTLEGEIPPGLDSTRGCEGGGRERSIQIGGGDERAAKIEMREGGGGGV
jgi:hypothetical protein